MHREIAVSHQRSDAQPAAGERLDLRHGEPRDVDHLVRLFDLVLEQIDQVGPAAEKLRARVFRLGAHRVFHAARP